jgi:aryl-alcohol dehydrogenase-like predicted oxidoreductase/predicted kinase
MRLSTDEDRDERRALATIAAALDAGVTVYDTARAYAPGPDRLGHNERLLARALDAAGPRAERVRIVTKGGMTRTGGGWVPDGRARSILADCEASLEALGGRPIDLYLLHAPDPRTPWSTSVRTLARLLEEGLVGRIGICNINRTQLEEAEGMAPIAAVQVALSVHDDRALRGGVIERCERSGIALMAHSPLGGARRAGGLAQHRALAEVAERRGASPAEVALAWLLELSPAVVAIAGARRPETARSVAHAAAVALDAHDLAALNRGFGRSWPPQSASPPAGPRAEVVLVMGIPGAGKSRAAQPYVQRGYVRLNRDERGGSLRGLAMELDAQLSAGAEHVVLDNTYLSRTARSYVIDVARRHGALARCIWIDIPLEQAQVNLASRIIDRCGCLPDPQQLRALARREPGLMMPTSQMRALRELEPPSTDEGFATVERVPFERDPPDPETAGGVLIAARALTDPDWEHALGSTDPDAPHLIFDWRPGGTRQNLASQLETLSRHVRGPIEVGLCDHPAGPPSCWCRPPLPGLALAFARRHGLDLARTTLVGDAPAHRTLARALGARYLQA